MRPSLVHPAPRSPLVRLVRGAVVGLLLSAAALVPAPACGCGPSCGCRMVTIQPAAAATTVVAREAPQAAEQRPAVVYADSQQPRAIPGAAPRPLDRTLPSQFQRPPPVLA